MPLVNRTLFHRLPTPCVVLAFAVYMLVSHLYLPAQIRVGEPGAKDFLQYWAGYQLLNNGGNVYNPAELLAAERLAGLQDPRPVMYWAPPWFLWLASPLLDRSFESAAALWMRFSFSLYLMAIFIGALCSRRGPTMAGLCLPLLFAPFFDCLVWGQSSTFLALVVAVCLLAVSRASSDRVSGLLLGASIPLLTLKPHLFIVAAAYPLVRLRKNLPAITLGFFSSLIVLFLIFLDLPVATRDGWLSSLRVSEHLATDSTPLDARLDWITPTIAGLTRMAVVELSAGHLAPPTWPLFAIPILGFVFLLAWSRKQRNADWASPSQILFVLLISLLCAPYGWHYDTVLLVAPLTAVICDAKSVRTLAPIAFAVLIPKILMSAVTAQHQFIIFTLLLLGAVLRK